MNTPDLKTRRLLLRGVTLADAPAMQHHFANWNVVRNIGSDIPWPIRRMAHEPTSNVAFRAAMMRKSISGEFS